MSNVLKVTEQQAIESLAARGWSYRRIARELKINRRTVQRYAKCTISTAGSEPVGIDSKCTISIPGKAGRRSECETFAETIGAKLALGLNAVRIHRELKVEHGFEGSYQSVKRYVARAKASTPKVVWRLESQPGEEMQADFGAGPMLVDGSGKRRRSWVFRVVLSYSRKAYSEAVYRQDTETFLRCIENAVRSFGGVPLLLNLDNLKAAVLKADWFDPEINPKLAAFCRHYGMHATPCRPRTPEHKGKVERSIGYQKQSLLKGREFQSLSELNQALRQWEEQVADKRIHGTTCMQVGARFAEERPHLQPLPASLFPAYQEAQRQVHRDGHIELAKAFYHVPVEYIAQQVWVRWDGRTVRVLNQRQEQIAMHPRLEPGQFTKKLGTGGWSGPVMGTCRYMIERIAVLGDACGRWAETVYERRGIESLRALQGFYNLHTKHSAHSLNRACVSALQHGACRLRDVRRLLEQTAEQTTFGFAESHPLIRDLSAYGHFITQNQSLETDTDTYDNQHTKTTCPHPEALGTA